MTVRRVAYIAALIFLAATWGYSASTIAMMLFGPIWGGGVGFFLALGGGLFLGWAAANLYASIKYLNDWGFDDDKGD